LAVYAEGAGYRLTKRIDRTVTPHHSDMVHPDLYPLPTSGKKAAEVGSQGKHNRE
jgi:hypothetical protein